MAKALRDHFLRIDGRSLGLFRLSFGVVLLGDLFRRWAYAKEFYSNDGVLPNHNHLFNLREKEQVWSLLHSISSPGEADFAFSVILFVYACFLIGHRTRAAHLASLVCLVSLSGRNILLENSGNYVALALLAFTAFLPLGSRFSLDSLRASLALRDEKTAAELDDRRRPDADVVNDARLPGWSPASLAGLALLGQLAVIYLAAAVQQKGPLWQDGTALHYALNSERWVSAAGAAARGALGPAVLAAWTRAFRAVEWAIPVLIFLPVAPRLTRGLAIGLAVFHALTLGVFFSFGLYAWSLLAATALLLPRATWDAVEEHPAAGRVRTVIYDADCGLCLWLTRVLKRLDLRGNLTFQGNDDLDGLARRKAGVVSRDPLPAEVTADLAAGSVVVVDPQGHVFTRSRAVSEVVQALPLGAPLALVMRLPGLAQLLDLFYDFIAARRLRISVAMGKAACGLPAPEGEAGAPAPYAPEPVAPSTRLRRGLQGVLRDLAVAVVFAAMLSQTGHENDLGWKLPRPGWLAGVATWPRMMARWDVLASPPMEDEVVVVDGQTKGGASVDPLTGKEPEWNPGAMRGTGLGQLWNDYLYRIHDPKWIDFQRAFRDYITKGGPRLRDPVGDNQLTGLDAYWLKQPIPPPGEARAAALSGRDKMFTQSRGGRGGTDRVLPLLRPELLKPR